MDQSIVKRCCTCKQEKPMSSFGLASGLPDGKKKRCRDCHNKGNREYRDRNPIKAAESSARWAKSNPERVAAKRARWEDANPGRGALLRSEWAKENREKIRQYHRKRRESIDGRIHHSISSRMYFGLKGKKFGAKTIDILGYGIGDLIAHLERQFTDGMSWENYGEWEIDHITPLSAFKIDGPYDPQIRAAWCLSNLRPLWWLENIKKKDRILFLI